MISTENGMANVQQKVSFSKPDIQDFIQEMQFQKRVIYLEEIYNVLFN